MSPKVLSPYPPDRWIRTLNQRYPNLWMELQKAYAAPSSFTSPAGKVLLSSVPDWCIMPTMFPCTYLSVKNGELFYLTHMDEVMTIASMYIWRCSKGIYRFAPEIYRSLITQPLTGDLPMDILRHLPEWACTLKPRGFPMSGTLCTVSLPTWTSICSLTVQTFSLPCSWKAVKCRKPSLCPSGRARFSTPWNV